MDWVDYREQLGIGLNDDNKGRRFIVNMFNFLNVINEYVDVKDYMAFCVMTGTPADVNDYKNDYFDYILNDLSSHTKDVKDFISYYVAFLNTHDSQYSFLGLIKEQLQIAHIDYEIIDSDGKCFIFPKGVSEFDKSLVSDTLQWLANYPNARQEWGNALKKYSNVEKASDVADAFRKALEQFFQEFFSCGKSLENCKGEYGNYLKEQGVPKEIANDFEGLLKLYTDFNNNYAKHSNKAESNVLEYIMYQTGNIMRLLITL